MMFQATREHSITIENYCNYYHEYLNEDKSQLILS